MKASDLARGRQAFEKDRIRRLVRQHQAQKGLRKDEILPHAGILGFLAGWFLMSGVENIFNGGKKQ